MSFSMPYFCPQTPTLSKFRKTWLHKHLIDVLPIKGVTFEGRQVSMDGRTPGCVRWPTTTVTELAFRD